MESNKAISDRPLDRAAMLRQAKIWSVRGDKRCFSHSKYAHHGRQVAPRKRDMARNESRKDKRTANPFIFSDNYVDMFDLLYGDLFGPTDEERYPQYAEYMTLDYMVAAHIEAG